MVSNDDIIDDDAVKLLHKIVKEAKSDGILSDDERKIIDIVQRHLWDVSSEIEVAMQNGKNTPEMIEQLREMLHGVLEKATEVANEDGQITTDERNLLGTLDKYISSDNVTGLLTEYLDMFL